MVAVGGRQHKAKTRFDELRGSIRPQSSATRGDLVPLLVDSARRTRGEGAAPALAREGKE
jgi:hypothetical protein